jgi:hypothetical protein
MSALTGSPLVDRIGCSLSFAQEKEFTMLPLTIALIMTCAPGTRWLDDYSKATASAMEEKKDLVIHFHGKENLDKALDDVTVKRKLDNFVCLRLPVDFAFEGKKLLDYPALADMKGQPGLVVVSFHDSKLPTHGMAISAHPLMKSRYAWVPAYGPEQIKIMLSLPAKATVTQRSMIYAIRVHPEVPQSVYCDCHPAFLAHAQAHTQRQANMNHQHHADLIATSNWLRTQGANFGGASEVVAESWGRRIAGDESVIEGAFCCVDMWHHSPGHWGAVAGQHSYFGYDICQAQDGTWYACGIFGN